ncbi:type 1 periplasmic-binding domain-containing protein [Kitasatospora azatica]|uniref:hypothetical protein n=1 Tax=Kitasatospora azatica TaxID=58347 RepID=UPI00056D12C1|nr:hypothetical protein [Kitasatospora azatica]
MRGRTRVAVAVVGGLAAAAAAGAVLLLGGSGHAPVRPAKVVANDVSGRGTACLAADSATAAAGATVTGVWSAMQAAAGTGQQQRNVQQLIMPATDAEQARPYLAGLLSQRCDLIVTVGRPFGQAAPALSVGHQGVRFVAVDAALPGDPPPGVTLLAGDQAPDAVRRQVSEMAVSKK